jgi:hypothetical protein
MLVDVEYKNNYLIDSRIRKTLHEMNHSFGEFEYPYPSSSYYFEQEVTQAQRVE